MEKLCSQFAWTKLNIQGNEQSSCLHILRGTNCFGRIFTWKELVCCLAAAHEWAQPAGQMSRGYLKTVCLIKWKTLLFNSYYSSMKRGACYLSADIITTPGIPLLSVGSETLHRADNGLRWASSGCCTERFQVCSLSRRSLNDVCHLINKDASIRRITGGDEDVGSSLIICLSFHHPVIKECAASVWDHLILFGFFSFRTYI